MKKKLSKAALAIALALVMVCPAYAAASDTDTAAVTEALVLEDWTPVKYNSKGEPYGTIIQARTQGIELDLLAMCINGQEGYMRESDTVWGKWKNLIKTPADALKYMEELHSRPAKELLPLYDSEGNVIGEYLYTNWSDNDFNHSDAGMDLEAAREARRNGK